MSPIDRLFLEESLASSAVLSLLPLPIQGQLVRAASAIRCNGATLLCAADEKPEMLYLVHSGHIELTARTADGQEMTITALGTGSWISWLGIFDDRPINHDLVGASGTITFAIPAKLVREAVAGVPACYPAIIAEIGNRFRVLIDWVEQSALVGRERRLAQLLLSLAKAAGGSQDTVFLARARIARLLGCSRQTLYDALRRLVEGGLIRLSYGRIHILDRQAMEQFA